MTVTVPLSIAAKFRPHPTLEKEMKLTELLLARLEREGDCARSMLQRVPEGHNDWKPHPTSMALGCLASLIAILPAWIATMVNQDELDLKSPAAAKFKAPEWSKRTALVTALDDSLAQAREALENTTDEHLLTRWRFVVGGQAVDESPRHVMITDSVFSHMAHHRGQLTVYLRMSESSVPAFCETSDEGLVA